MNCPLDSRITTVDSKPTCIAYKDIAKNLENFIKIRNSICQEFNINCYTMLQPFSSVHGKYFEKYEKSQAPETGMLKDVNKNYEKKIIIFELMQKIDGIVDISMALDNETTLSYVDRSHYSPQANKAIANYIFLQIKDILNEG